MEIKLKPFVETAHVWKNMSSCARVHVGAVIINMETKRLLSIGYNGTLPGQVHCNELFLPNHYISKKLCDFIPVHLTYSVIETDSKIQLSKDDWMRLHHEFSERYEVHAEQNAIYNLLKTGSSYDPKNLAIICTTEPCYQCAKAIAALGIKHVFYVDAYDRNNSEVRDFFNKVGIICRQIKS